MTWHVEGAFKKKKKIDVTIVVKVPFQALNKWYLIEKLKKGRGRRMERTSQTERSFCGIWSLNQGFMNGSNG